MQSLEIDKYKEIKLGSLQKEPFAFQTSFEEASLWSEDSWNRMISIFNFGFPETRIIEELDNRYVGMIGILYHERKKVKHVAEIIDFYVQEEYRGKGLGKKLMKKALDEITRKEYIKKIKLTVTVKQQSAIELYKKFGFEEVGKLKDEIINENESIHVLIMEKYLS